MIFDSGPIGRAACASAPVPGIFEPVVDDGVMNNIPCDVVRSMRARKVVAVDLNAERSHSGMPANLFDVSYRSFALLLDMTSAVGRKDADLLILARYRRFPVPRPLPAR